MRALVVGLGHMGKFHARVLRDLGYTVHAVDPRPEAQARYTNTRSALLACKYDVAAVAVPAPYLAECAFELAGIPMLVEKPFSTNPREAAMLGAYLTARGRVCVGYVERFNPRVRELKERLSQNATMLRSATFVRHSDRPSADPATDLLTHDVDLARHLFHDTWGNRATTMATYDYGCEKPAKKRTITVEVNTLQFPPAMSHGRHTDETWTVDLMDHGTSPLHAMWHAFLIEGDHPTPDDAVLALLGAREVVESQPKVDLRSSAGITVEGLKKIKSTGEVT